MSRRSISVPGLGVVVAVMLVFWADSLPAQVLKQVVESLAPASAKPDSGTPKKEPSAYEQLAWVEGRIQEARERVGLVRSAGFLNKVRSAGFSEEMVRQIQNVATTAEEGWINSKNLLDFILIKESVGLSDREEPTLPENTTQALVLERELEDIKGQLSRFQRELAVQSETLDSSRLAAQSAGRELDKLRSQADKPLTASLKDRSDILILQAEMANDSATAELYFQNWEGYFLQTEIRLYQARLDTVAKLLDESGYSRIISPERAALEIQRVENTLVDFQKEEERQSALQAKAAERLAEARARLNSATPDSLPTLQKEAQAVLEEFGHQNILVSGARARVFAARQTIDLWQLAQDLLNSPDIQTLEHARSEISISEAKARNYSEGLQNMLPHGQEEIEKWRQDLRNPDLSNEEKTRIEKRIKKQQSAVDAILLGRGDLAALLALQNRLLREIDTEMAALAARHRWSFIAGQLWQNLTGIWNFQLNAQGDRVVTLGTIITGLAALALALILARITARRVSALACNRLHLPGSRAHLVEKLTLYALSVLFVLMALQWLQIPITVFAFLGGALAVGIGFGSQNLINNFISGLLLLLEQKINVGDLVEVDGKFGRVTDLGSRCSSIRKSDGVEILVPNSALLEKNVVNWTLSDPHHRFDFPVGVAYGSDVELVIRTLQEAMDAQPEILRDPAPEVAFDNFGDSTLGFHVYYWLTVGNSNTRQIGSQLRVRIDRLFKERSLEMAFPQRVVHLVPQTPIQVRLAKEP